MIEDKHDGQNKHFPKLDSKTLSYLIRFQQDIKKTFDKLDIDKINKQMNLLKKAAESPYFDAIKHFSTLPKAFDPIKYQAIQSPGILTELRRRRHEAKLESLLGQLVQNTSRLQYARVTIDEIDSFCEASKVSEEDIDKFMPLDIHENEIKKRLLEIIGDPFIKKDWGGEKSDIFTYHVKFRNRKTLGAFLLKGKTSIRGLTLKNIGKNSDQIVRLFSEPAELYFVQANGSIDSAVVATVQAFVTQKIQEGHKIYYCLIDGVDTARILLAYNKLDKKTI